MAPTNQRPERSSSAQLSDAGVGNGKPLSNKFSWTDDDIVWTTPLPELQPSDTEMREMIMDGLAAVTSRAELAEWLDVASEWIRDNPKDDDVAHALSDATQRAGS